MRISERELKLDMSCLTTLVAVVAFSACTPVVVTEDWGVMTEISNREFGQKVFLYNNDKTHAICVFDHPKSTKREFFVFSKTQNDVIYKKVLINGGVVRWYDNRLIEIKSFGNNPREEVESYFFNVKTKRIQTDEETKDL